MQVGTEGEDLGAAAGAGGPDSGLFGQGVERPERFADESIAGVGAGRDGGDGETGVDEGGEVLVAVDGEVDETGGEGFFDLLDEDAFAVEAGWDDEAGLLHAVAGGADDLDFGGVAVGAKFCGDVVGLPECELRAAGADTDVCHVLGRIRRADKTHRPSSLWEPRRTSSTVSKSK